MRLPAYAKALLKSREAGGAPWLVVVALGQTADFDVLRGEAGVARIGVPFDIPIEAVDFSAVRYLDVLVSCFRPESVAPIEAAAMHQAAIAALAERGAPATLWAASLDGARAAAVSPVRFGYSTCGPWRPLDATFRAEVAWARKCALLGCAGVFARPEFDPARERVLRDLAAGHALH